MTFLLLMLKFPFENSTSVLKPILINPGGELLDQHQRFIDLYDSEPLIFSIGQNIKTSYETITLDKSPVDPDSMLNAPGLPRAPSSSSGGSSCSETILRPHGAIY